MITDESDTPAGTIREPGRAHLRETENMTIEATNQNGAGKKITDRSGRVWEYANYTSPSGPAFWLTLPDELCPEGAGNYTVHFDGVMGASQAEG